MNKKGKMKREKRNNVEIKIVFFKLGIKDRYFLHSYVHNDNTNNTNIYMFIVHKETFNEKKKMSTCF